MKVLESRPIIKVRFTCFTPSVFREEAIRLKEYSLTIHSFEEAAYFVDFLEKYDLHGTLSDQKSIIDCRSFMGILSNDLIKKKITLKVHGDAVTLNTMDSKIKKVIKNRYTV